MSAQDWKQEVDSYFLRRKSWLMPLGGGILVLVGLGYALGAPNRGQDDGDKIEIIPAEERILGENKEIILVDVSGAVETPGVYELNRTARINDALVAAGGLNLKADRSWVGRYLNRAQVLQDGMKIYVPEAGESVNNLGGIGAEVIGEAKTGQISINTASKSELDSLWGIGEVRAEAIINNRPYQNIEELKTKANIPQSVIDKNSGKISL